MKMKKKLLAILTLACACTFSTGLVVANAQENEVTTQSTSVFRVVDGASIRVSDIDTSYGIRFIAEVGEEDVDANYNFMIAPSYLVDVYEADTTQNKVNLVDYIKSYAEARGGSVAIVEDCSVGQITVNETTTINGIYGSIVDLYWLNLNRDFVGIAFTTDAQGTVTRVADLAEDGKRSIADVAEKTLETGMETYLDVVEEIALRSEKSIKGIVADSETDEAIFTKTDTFNREETIVNGIDDTYGNYWGFQYPTEEGNTEWKIDSTTLMNRLKGYEKVSFSIYNPYGGDRPLYLEKTKGGFETNYGKIPAGEWMEISMSVSEFSSLKYILMGGTNTADKTVKFSQIKAYTKVEVVAQLKSQAADTVTLINELPEENAVTMLDGAKIQKAYEAFTALPEDAQAYVTNAGKLQAVAGAWSAKFALVHDMKSQTGISINTSYAKGSLSLGNDEIYGDYIAFDYKQLSSSGHGLLKYSIADLETKLEGYDKVCFYVYNPTSSDQRIIANFGNISLNTRWSVLKANSWSLVGATVEDFLSGTQFGIAGTTEGVYKISAMIAVKEDVTECLQLVTFNSTTGITAKTDDSNAVTKTSLMWGYDAEHGYNVGIGRGSYNATDNTRKLLLLNYDFAGLATQLEGYDKVFFYVYNPFAVDANFYSNFGGAATTGVTLKAGEWTKVEVTVSDFVQGTYFGIKCEKNVSTSATSYYYATYKYFRFSSFMATKDNA